MSGVRFFNMSYADPNRRGVSLAIDNQENNIDALVNRDPLWVWESSGSDDTDDITFTIEFDRSREVSSLLLLGNNLKEFTLQRRDGAGAWIAVLSETSNVDVDYFNEFSPVTTDAVRLIMSKTMVSDEEKTIREFIVTKSIGQLEGYPKLRFSVSGASQQKTMFGGKTKFVANEVSHNLDLTFKDHIGDNDRDLFKTLLSLTESFLVWPCGGDETQFAHGDIGYRRGDVYLMGVARGANHEFTKNLYFSGFNSSLRLSEAA